MANTSVSPVAAELAGTAARRRPLWRSRTVTGIGLLLPAIAVSIVFAIIPLIYLFKMSLTKGSTFFFTTTYTLANYREIWDRYLPTVQETVYLALLASLLDLVLGYPFAYILIRKVHYREFVRTMMTFPLFGTLYLAFGMHYLLLPNGPLGGVVAALGIPATRLLYSLPSVLFAMALFTFPFMVMNVGAALSNVDPVLQEAATCLGARPWQTFWRVLLPLSWGGIIAGFLMCFGWNLGVYVVPQLLGTIKEQRVLSIALYQKGLIQFNYGLSAAMGIVLMVLAFGVTWISLRFSRGQLGV